jgi:putative RNA 2'-phosphotransferase
LVVDLGYESATPPELLFHGTGVSLVEAIRRDGLLKMSRHQVHLSADRETATQVGQRKGKPVILGIRAGDMANDGHTFHRSDNGVWLVEHVPVDYISFPD